MKYKILSKALVVGRRRYASKAGRVCGECTLVTKVVSCARLWRQRTRKQAMKQWEHSGLSAAVALDLNRQFCKPSCPRTKMQQEEWHECIESVVQSLGDCCCNTLIHEDTWYEYVQSHEDAIWDCPLPHTSHAMQQHNNLTMLSRCCLPGLTPDMLRAGVSQTKYDKLIQGLDRLALAFLEDEKDDREDCLAQKKNKTEE